MWLQKLAKDNTSGETGCPAAYLAESGEFVVQGPLVDDDTMSRLENRLPGETAVRIDPQVIVDAARRYTESQWHRRPESRPVAETLVAGQEDQQ